MIVQEAPTSGTKLSVPAAFATQLDRAVNQGFHNADTFAERHRPEDSWKIISWGTLNVPWPPRDDKPELQYMHQVAQERTPAGIERAQFWARNGLNEVWQSEFERYAKHVSPEQAREGQRLLDDARMLVSNATQIAKGSALRPRPFVVDPTLPLVVDRPGNNPSFPSGHTSAAYAAAIVLGHLMPERKEHFLELAQEASWSRVYGGVHFPSDVIAGAQLAATIAGYLVKHEPR